MTDGDDESVEMQRSAVEEALADIQRAPKARLILRNALGKETEKWLENGHVFSEDGEMCEVMTCEMTQEYAEHRECPAAIEGFDYLQSDPGDGTW